MAGIDKKVILVAPHSQEHAVALPFQAALSEKLRSKGVLVEEHAFESQKRWADIRRRLKPNTENEDLLLNELLTYLDVKQRLVFLSSFSPRNGVIVEIHGAHADLFDGSKSAFLEILGFNLLEGFKLFYTDSNSYLVKYNYVGSFLLFDINSARSYFYPAIEALIGVPLIKADQHLRSLAKEIKGANFTIEVPGKFEKLSRNDSNYSLYFNEIDKPKFKFGSFEEIYCAEQATTPLFTEREIDAALKLILDMLPA